MTTQTANSLRVTRKINAAVERVFEAWTDQDRLLSWFCPKSMEVADASVDFRVGGRYRVSMRSPEGRTFTAVGEYREIEPPNRLCFTWDWEEEDYGVGETLVTVELVERSGSTEVVLTHGGFANQEAVESHTEGWNSCFDRLESLLAG
jgi:glutathione S-transferase